MDYKDATISQVSQDLRIKTGYKFYYDPAQLDSLRVTLKASQVTLPVMLGKIFSNSAYRYAITPDHEVIITKHVVINTDLPPGYFNGDQASASTDLSVN